MKHVKLIKLALWSLVLVSTSVYGDPIQTAPQYRTYVSIEAVSKDTSIEITFPGQKAFRPQETGTQFEVPISAVKFDKFLLTVQMDKKGDSYEPCQISVEQVNQFDRRYICSVIGQPSTQVEVRVYTNLHGGDKLRPGKAIAKR